MAPSPSQRKHVLLAPASGEAVGGGHIMRTLCLAQALANLGADCVFAADAYGCAIIERFGGGQFRIDQRALPAILTDQVFDVLVLDGYQWSSPQEQALRPLVRALAVIDDLADRPHLADLLIDPGYGRSAADYADLLPNSARVLTGPTVALVRAEFLARRPEALARPISADPERVFLSFGLSDVGGVAARATALIRQRHAKVQIDVAIASQAVSTSLLRARANADLTLKVYEDAQGVASLLAEADVAIGAGGASTWERCTLGVPTLAVIVADNQRPMIEAMMGDGVLVAVELNDPFFDQAFISALDALWTLAFRTDLKARSADLCDGRGAERAARALLSL